MFRESRQQGLILDRRRLAIPVPSQQAASGHPIRVVLIISISFKDAALATV